MLSVLGMGIMLRLAWEALKAAGTAVDTQAISPASRYGDFATGAVLSLSNPFNIVFWTGIGATAFSGIPDGPRLSHFIIFFSAFMTGAFLWCFFMAGLVAWGRRFITSAFFRWTNLVCGLALAFFALQLGWKLVQNLV
jgi:chemosensory pili system protein ChpE